MCIFGFIFRKHRSQTIEPRREFFPMPNLWEIESTTGSEIIVTGIETHFDFKLLSFQPSLDPVDLEQPRSTGP
jgi:hypothetical protein